MQWLASPSPEAQSSRPPSRSPLQPHAATAVAQTCCNISPRRTGLVPSLPGQGLAGRLGHKLSDKRAGGNRTSNVGEVHCLQPSELAWLHWQKRKVRPQRGRQRATGVSRLEVWAQGPHHPCPPAPLSALYHLVPPCPSWAVLFTGHTPPGHSPHRPPFGPHLGLRHCVCAQACLQLPHHHLPLPLGDGLAALVPCGHQPVQV